MARRRALAAHLGGERGQDTAVRDLVAVRAAQVAARDLAREGRARKLVEPEEQPVAGARERVGEHLGEQRLLRFEVGVEGAHRQPGRVHHLGDAALGVPALAEQAARRVEDLPAGRVLVARFPARHLCMMTVIQ